MVSGIRRGLLPDEHRATATLCTQFHSEGNGPFLLYTVDSGVTDENAARDREFTLSRSQGACSRIEQEVSLIAIRQQGQQSMLQSGTKP